HHARLLITTCFLEFTVDSVISKRARQHLTRSRVSTRRIATWKRRDETYPRPEAHPIPEVSVCSDSRLGWLRECFRMLGCASALIFTSSLAVAQSTPNVQFTDVTAQSHVDFTLQNSATSNKYLIETMAGGVA